MPKNAAINSLLVTRVLGRGPDSELDMKVLILEYASYLLISKGVKPTKLKEQLPALYDSVVKGHPLYVGAAARFKSKYQPASERQLAAAVSDADLQNKMMELAGALASAEEQYLASVNTVQQVASEVLSNNIRAMRRTGKFLKRHLDNERVKRVLQQHDEYLETLAKTEKVMQSCIERITQEINGQERYTESCDILINAVKKSMRRGRKVDVQATKANKKQKSFLRKVKSKFSALAIQEALIISFLPDIYEAIGGNISDQQMQALVDLAGHYIELYYQFDEVTKAFSVLPPSIRESLAKGGVKLQSLTDYVMAVAYDPAQMAVHYFNDQYEAYLSPLYAAKDAASTVADLAYQAASVIVSPFAYAASFFVRGVETGFSQLSRDIISLEENAYYDAMAFYQFVNGLGCAERGEAKKALFDHYFKLNDHSGQSKLTYEAYLSNENSLGELCHYYDSHGALRNFNQAKLNARDKNQYHLALMARLAQLKIRLNGMRAINGIDEIVNELNGYRRQLGEDAAFEATFMAKLRELTPIIHECLLVPVIYRLVDEGRVNKQDPQYHYLHEVLKALQQKTLITMSDVTAVLALAGKSEADAIQPIMNRTAMWVLGAPMNQVVMPALTDSLMLRSIATDKQKMRVSIEQTLKLLQPRLILMSVIAHLDDHIQACNNLEGLPAHFAELNAAKLKYCQAVKGVLEAILNGDAFSSHKKLATALRGATESVTMASLDQVPLAKRDIAKLLLRVADEFGPVSSGSEDTTPLVTKIMNFVLSQMDSDALTSAYQAYCEISENKGRLAQQSEADDLLMVWFDDETSDPLDMETQKSSMGRAIVKHYTNALIDALGENATMGSVIDYLNQIPGFEWIVDQLSHLTSTVFSKEVVVNLICQLMGLQASANVHSQPYVLRLSHAFFKMRALNQGLEIAMSTLGLEGDSEDDLVKMHGDLEALQAWAKDYSFKPSESPVAMAEGVFVGDASSRSLKIQVLLTHCENLEKYTKRLNDASRRQEILLNVMAALRVCRANEAYEEQLTDEQVKTLERLLASCEPASEAAAKARMESVGGDTKVLGSEVQQLHDGVVREMKRKRTILNILSYFSYYIGDLGLLGANIWSLASPVMSCVAAIKGLSLVTVQAVFSAVGTALVGVSLVGLAFVAARFVWNLGYQSFLHRHAFRKDWKNSQSPLGKAGVIAKYTFLVLGKSLLAMFLTAAMVDTVVGVVKKIRKVDIPLVTMIKNKLSARARLRELEAVNLAFRILKRTSVDDSGFVQQVATLQVQLDGLKYHKKNAEDWKARLGKIVENANSLKEGEGQPRSTGRIQLAMAAAPEPVPAPAPQPVRDWPAFVRARESQVGRVIHFSRDPDGSQFASRLGRNGRSSIMGSSIFASSSSMNSVIGSEPMPEPSPDTANDATSKPN